MPDETTRACANRILMTLPAIMRGISSGEVRMGGENELSVPQFRALMMLKHCPGAPLSELAEFLISSLSSASKLIDGLVERGFVTRVTSPVDRRRVLLTITESGATAMRAVHLRKVERLAEILRPLAEDEVAVVMRAMDVLQTVAISAPQAIGNSEPGKE